MTTQTTTQPAIIYPETDDQPMPDAEYQSLIFRKALTPLENHFRKVPGARVNGNTFLYYVEGDPKQSVSPDCYVVFGITPEAIHSLSQEGNNTYLLWEVGKPPDFVMEIASHSTRTADLVSKRRLYAELGIPEYWRYDQTGGDFYGDPLVGERLVDGEYQPIPLREDEDGRVWARSDVLNLDLYWDDGNLRYWNPVAEEWLLDYEEEHEERLAERAGRLEERAGRLAAESRADQEQAARQAAQEQAAQEQAARLAAEERAAQEQAARQVAESRSQELATRLAELQAQLRGNGNPPPSR